MFAAVFPSFWVEKTAVRDSPARPKPRPTPVFIGDATLPWNGSTMLLEIMKRDNDRLNQDDTDDAPLNR